MAWRFYTVPGNPAKGFENEAMAMAAKTWTGEWWKLGGGGTVWDSFAVDPELNLIYIGVGNGGPWNREIRSPEGGDNLFLSSIVAVNADTGEYVWHYQETPGESWDYTATQHIILADINWQGETRKVLMQAPKNGFFFIIDRVTGEFLSAEPYTKVNWATHYDTNGRPVENPDARYIKEQFLQTPSAIGGHNWHPMSYNPMTGFVYIPAIRAMMPYKQPESFEYKPHHYNLGVELENQALISPAFMQKFKDKLLGGELIAWDPVRQQRAWTYQHQRTWNGGTLSTAGNLVFQGTADHHLMAFNALTGEPVWQYPTRLAIVAAPITFSVNGEQYVAVAAKWGGAVPMQIGLAPYNGLEKGRLLVFKLGGNDTLPEAPTADMTIAEPPPLTITDETSLARGEKLYEDFCVACHGLNAVSSGNVPDLRYRIGNHDAFQLIVMKGALRSRGMVAFDDVLTEKDTEMVYNYLLSEAHAVYDDQQPPLGQEWLQDLKLWCYDKLSSLIAWLASLA
jgi:mono/diheme cytochrome c family protein